MRFPARSSLFEIAVLGLSGRLLIAPSLPVAVGLVALAGAWALEQIFVAQAFSAQKDVARAAEAATRAALEADSVKVLTQGIESRLTRIENKDGFRRG